MECKKCKKYEGTCSGIVVKDGVAYFCRPYLSWLRGASFQHRLAESGVPRRWWNILAETACDEYNHEALGRAVELAQGKSDRWGLVLCGRVGTGKTHVACYAFALFLKANPQARGFFVSVPELVAEPRRAFEDGAFEAAKRAHIVLIDDFGMETDWVFQFTSGLLHHCYSNRVPYIVTTNVAQDDLERAVGTRLFSRFSETAHLITLRGPDRRRGESVQHSG